MNFVSSFIPESHGKIMAKKEALVSSLTLAKDSSIQSIHQTKKRGQE